ncbi:MAG: gamma-glutamyl-phosphate reductase, partial [Deltaproteobacteria bacterium]
MMTVAETIRELAVRAKEAGRNVAALDTGRKNQVLERMAEALLAEQTFIREENEKDLAAGRDKGLSGAMLDRLALSDKVMASMVTGLREVAALPDPVGEIADMG